jgi:hypothetical protein
VKFPSGGWHAAYGAIRDALGRDPDDEGGQQPLTERIQEQLRP